MGAYWGCYRGARARASIQDFDAILFDDRIGQHFMRDGFDVRLRLLARGSTGQRDFEELALTDFGDGGEPEAVERRAHGLALRVENGGLRSYEYASFHGNSNYRMAGGRSASGQHFDSLARSRQTQQALVESHEHRVVSMGQMQKVCVRHLVMAEQAAAHRAARDGWQTVEVHV